MTKEEIMQTIEEKAAKGITVTAVSGNTNPDSDLGYYWEYYIDTNEEYWYLNFYHCGNGRGCFSVTDSYDYNSYQEAYASLIKEALKTAGYEEIIEFSDGSQIIS